MGEERHYSRDFFRIVIVRDGEGFFRRWKWSMENRFGDYGEWKGHSTGRAMSWKDALNQALRKRVEYRRMERVEVLIAEESSYDKVSEKDKPKPVPATIINEVDPPA